MLSSSPALVCSEGAWLSAELAFAAIVSPALVMNAVVFSGYFLQPESLVVSGVGVCSYTATPALVMNAVVFSSSCLQPRSLVVGGVGVGQTCCGSAWRRGLHCKVCSAVWSSWPMVHARIRSVTTSRIILCTKNPKSGHHVCLTR